MEFHSHGFSTMTRVIPDRSIRICADRGGTFCDVHAFVLYYLCLSPFLSDWSYRRSFPDPERPKERKEIVVKLRSLLQFTSFTISFIWQAFSVSRSWKLQRRSDRRHSSCSGDSHWRKYPSGTEAPNRQDRYVHGYTCLHSLMRIYPQIILDYRQQSQLMLSLSAKGTCMPS